MTNNELPINCPKCKRTMRLDDPVENIDEVIKWNGGYLTEKYICRNCGHIFYADIFFNIDIKAIYPTNNED